MAAQGGWLSADAQIHHGQIIFSVFMLCSAAHVNLENQLTVNCLALVVDYFNIISALNPSISIGAFRIT